MQGAGKPGGNTHLPRLSCGAVGQGNSRLSQSESMTTIEAPREWLCRFVFTITGLRPKLGKLSDRDVALLFSAIDAAECAKLTSDAQAKCHSNHKGNSERKLGAEC